MLPVPSHAWDYKEYLPGSFSTSQIQEAVVVIPGLDYTFWCVQPSLTVVCERKDGWKLH
jgi:hypothetical protein